MRPGTPTDRPGGQTGDGRGRRWARSRAGHSAGTGRPGGGSAARPSVARSRRTSRGFVPAPRMRCGSVIWTRDCHQAPEDLWRSRRATDGLSERRTPVDSAGRPGGDHRPMVWEKVRSGYHHGRRSARNSAILCGNCAGTRAATDHVWAATLPSCAVICSAVTGCSGSVSRDTQDFESVGRRFDPCRAYHLKP